MKAYYSTRYGGSQYAFYGDLPDAIAQKGELLIEVKAVSINPVDYKIMSGITRIISGNKFPKIFGTDFAGIVKEITEGVSGFKPGDRVYGSSTIILGKQGALAELVAVKPEKTRHIPEGMSFEEAASLPVAGLTALNGLRKCNTGSGTRVLVNGATGGVGHFAVQIAKAKGAHVTATCSSSNAELAKKLGADVITGYQKKDLAGIKGQFDAIMDAYGKMSYPDICRLLKRGGTYVSTLFFPPAQFIAPLIRLFRGRKLSSSNMRALPEDYEEIEKLWKEKKLIPVIDSVFLLSKCGDAFYHTEHGKPKGKVVVRV
jgi:NADPH:quinone reductase-like Zn-dependent oxidoreductase